MDQNQMDTLITSIKGTDQVPKAAPVYARNLGQVDSNSTIDYGSDMSANRYRYATATLSITDFDHNNGKVLEITTSINERRDTYGWGSGTGSITEIKVVAKTYNLFCEYEQFTVEEITTHIKVYINAENKRADHNSEMIATCILGYVYSGTQAKLHTIYDDFKIGGMVHGEVVFKGLMN